MCEDHFADSCFMNYKKERLVKTAVPTLHAAKGGTIYERKIDEEALSVLVYNYNDKGKSIDLPDAKPIQLSMEQPNAATSDFADTIESLVEINNSSSSSGRDTNIAEPIVLNSACSRSHLKRFAVKNVQDKSMVARKNRSNGDDNAEIPLKRSRCMGDAEVDSMSLVCAKTYIKPNSTNTFVLQESTTDEPYDDTLSPMNSIPHTNNGAVDSESSASVADNTMHIQMLAEQAKQIEELKQMIADILTVQPKVEPNVCHTTAQATNTPQPIRVEKSPPMTKVQLFNGIRKYLNPSMVALLRMEMFGNPDRAYRVDEKQFAKELCGLNKSVYEFMRDEWRFRLPPIADVENWIKNPDEDETWELC